MVPFIYSSRKCKLLSNAKARSVVSWGWGEAGGGIIRRQKRNLVMMALYLDYGDGVYIAQTLPKCTLEMHYFVFQLNLNQSVKNFSSFYPLKIP